MVAVLATAAAVLAFGPPSSGIEVPTSTTTATTTASAASADAGTTVVTSGGTGGQSPMVSGNGRWQVYVSGTPANVYARDLLNATTTQLSLTTSTVPAGDRTMPSISDNGRYVSFIDTTGTGRVLVICDRDPNGNTDGDGNLLLDQPTAASNDCEPVVTTGLTGDGSLLSGDRPALAGYGTTIAWTQNAATSGVTSVLYSTVADSGGFLRDAGGALAFTAPQMVPMTVTTSAPACGTVTGNSEGQPAISQDGNEVAMTVGFVGGGCSAIVDAVLQSGTSRRVDVDPDDANAFIGDLGTSSGATYVDQPMISIGVSTTILFRYRDAVPVVPFAAPRTAAAVPLNTSLMIAATRSFSAPNDFYSQVASVDSAGQPMDSDIGAISRDGRFVAFGTNGADPALYDSLPASGKQIIARDLETGTDALVTPSTTTTCTAACPSSETSVSSLTLDATGARVSFASSATDLDSADTDPALDAYVRTWTPAASDDSSTLSDTQVNTSTTAQVPVTVSGFGPVTFGTPSIAGPDAGQFDTGGSTCTSATLYAGDSCNVVVVFAPTSIGTKTATVWLASTQFAAPREVRTVSALAVATGPVSAAADNIRTSLHDNGQQAATGGYDSMVSGNGRWDVFVSDSDLTGRQPLATPSYAYTNIFVRDLANPQHTLQISLHSAVSTDPAKASHPTANGTPANGASPDESSSSPSISSDGRFVSFWTQASDIVPPQYFGTSGTPPSDTATIVVCDRDPNGKKDQNGDPVLDQLVAGTKVPNYACYPVASHTGDYYFNTTVADMSTCPELSGDGTRITWVETSDFTDPRARVATLAVPGGKLQAPKDYAYVPSDITDFGNNATEATARDSGTVDQAYPALTEDGSAVVYLATQRFEGGVSAIIESTLPANLDNSTSTRFDVRPSGSGFLGDDGGDFDTSAPPAVSDDGTRVAFAYQSPKDQFLQVYVATSAGGSLTSLLESRDNNGRPSAGTSPALSGDGRYLAFQTSQPNEHNGVDPRGGSCTDSSIVPCQIVARDLTKDAALSPPETWTDSEIVSSSYREDCVANLPPGRLCAGNDDSSNPSIDATGSEIGFDSVADDIVAGDTNVPEPSDYRAGAATALVLPSATDAFVHTWRPTLQATSPFDFGSVDVGTPKTKTFTITESGFGPISLGAVSVAGTNPGDYKVVGNTCTGATLNDTETCQLKIRFTPSLPGSRPATLTVAVGKNGYPREGPDGTVYDPALTRDLTGVGRSPIAVVNPTTVDFGKHLPDAPKATKTVTVTNTGSAPLVITTVVVNDTTHPGAKIDYTLDFSDCLAATPIGGSCIIKVSFVGHKVGIRDAVLIITDNTPAGLTSVVLKGRVGKPKITVNPAVSPVGRVVTVSGTGFAPSQDVDLGFEKDVEITGKARANGTFDIQLVVLGNGPQGPRTLHAHSTGLDKSIAADTPFLIVLGSVDNTLNGIRH